MRATLSDCPKDSAKVGYGISKVPLKDMDPSRKYPPGAYDYHWWRKTNDGWKHKRGTYPVEDSGDPGAPGQNLGAYRFCGYLCVPGGTNLD